MSEADQTQQAVTESKPLRVEFDLGEFGGPISLLPAEARKWRDGELAAWDWVRELPPGEYAAIHNALGGARKNIRRLTDPNLINLDTNSSEASVRAVSESMAKAFAQSRYFTQATPQARLVQEMAATNKPMAAGALAYLWRLPLSQISGAMIEGMFKALALEYGISERAEKETQALEALRSEWQQRLIDETKRAEERTGQFDGLLARHQENAARFAADAAKLLEDQSAAHKEHHQAARDALTALEATYSAGLALKAPVTYWSDKRRYHAERAKVTTRLVAWYFVAGLVVLAIAAGQLLNVESRSALGLPVWHVALFASVLALFVWGARILVRLMLSHQHLEEDARERIVIANTYLALVRGGKLPETATDKVLEALLRHSPDGIVRDDALPLVVDMLKKAP